MEACRPPITANRATSALTPRRGKTISGTSVASVPRAAVVSAMRLGPEAIALRSASIMGQILGVGLALRQLRLPPQDSPRPMLRSSVDLRLPDRPPVAIRLTVSHHAIDRGVNPPCPSARRVPVRTDGADLYHTLRPGFPGAPRVVRLTRRAARVMAGPSYRGRWRLRRCRQDLSERTRRPL